MHVALHECVCSWYTAAPEKKPDRTARRRGRRVRSTWHNGPQ